MDAENVRGLLSNPLAWLAGAMFVVGMMMLVWQIIRKHPPRKYP
jgi:hypothetical protein